MPNQPHTYETVSERCVDHYYTLTRDVSMVVFRNIVEVTGGGVQPSALRRVPGADHM